MNVIGWAWIVLGAGMCIGSTTGLVVTITVPDLTIDDPEAPLFVRWFPLIAVIMMGVSFTGFISGIHFLKLNAWTRPVLEFLTWFLLLYIVCFMVCWEYMWITQAPANGPAGFKIMGVVMSLVISTIYIVPLVLMLKYLRGEKVKGAMS